MKQPVDLMTELLELTVKAGRRCAYDLAHAADSARPAEQAMFRERAAMWLTVFNPGNGPKEYRAELHREISKLEVNIRRLQALCDEHGIDHTDPNGIPF